MTEMVPGLAPIVATRTLGTKSRSCSAVAMTCCCCEYWPDAPSESPPTSNRNPPSANRRPPHRRRRCCWRFSALRSTAWLSCRSRLVASFRSRISRSFIGELLEYAIGRDTVIALAQHGKQIGDNEQCGGSREQEAADHRIL